MRVDREQVIAFRASAHHLDERLPAGRLAEAAAVCGVQNTPPTSASTALWARVTGVGPRDLDDALVARRSLLQTWSLRGAPHVFPSTDTAVFTRALLPADDTAPSPSLAGAEPLLERLGLAAGRLVDLAEAVLRDVLDGRTVTGKRQLDRELAGGLRCHLDPGQRVEWGAQSPFAPDQTVGEALSSFVLRPLAHRGVVCFAGRRGGQASFVRTDQWLGGPVAAGNDPAARAELAARYLRAYGPSTAGDFAGWAGVAPDVAGAAFRALQAELTEVEYAGERAWVLRRDRALLASPPDPTGVRLLPPLDPWVQLRDRATILPDPYAHRRVWTAQGWPGTVLLNGRLVGAWHARKHGPVLELRVESFAAVPVGAVRDEAAGLAALRGCRSAGVTLD